MDDQDNNQKPDNVNTPANVASPQPVVSEFLNNKDTAATNQSSTSQIFTKSMLEKQQSRNHHWLRWLFIALILFVIVAFGALLRTNYNFRATILNQKFRQYTLTNDKSETYQILFYKGSTIKSYKFGGAGSEKVLVSPPINKGGVSLALSLEGKPNDSNSVAQKDVQKTDNCTYNSFENVEAFKIIIKSLAVDANFCTNPTQDGVGPVTFISFFGNTSSVYFASIFPYNTGQHVAAKNVSALQATITNINDIKTIVASFQYQVAK